MAKIYSELTPPLERFIAKQHLFFTGTAPLASNGSINVSPKGIDTFRCLNNNTVAYLDLTGSGNETAAHLSENGRLTIMFCSFAEKPTILRLYGKGRVVRSQDADWQDLYRHFDSIPGERQIVVLAIQRVQTSCGFGVPLFEYKQQRNELIAWAERKGAEGLEAYRQKNNQTSVDGLPAYDTGRSPSERV
ncbi:pyridoxamine 5'-phosphate oxidase family protein [Synechococcus sp. PCC 7336]|uniref:pyridoxamine 5'-phosphate oxidase family protein n=1 Tax=Synechococcus sp. PCC 7336 TaxID=195250 RepID=UPI00034940F6|nr:pyridoxamine 5'-phosphate oxidase family protein [Synechococcus sp. PCC 7336]